MNRIAVMTSGGDAPGMNAAIRAAALGCLQRVVKHFALKMAKQQG